MIEILNLHRATPAGIDALMATTAKAALEDVSAKERERPAITSTAAAHLVKVDILASTVAKRASAEATPPVMPSTEIATPK